MEDPSGTFGDRPTNAFNDKLAEIRELLGLEDRTPGTVLLLLSHIPYLLGHIDVLSELVDERNNTIIKMVEEACRLGERVRELSAEAAYLRKE